MKKKKKRLFQRLADRHRGEGVAPLCEHFGQCGGCMFQDIAYENQLLLKRDYVNGLFEGIAEVDSVQSSRPFRYRNRMDMVAAFGKKGLRKAGFYKFVVDIESCPLMQESSNEAFIDLREILQEVEDYDYLKHEGYFRYIVLRQAMFTGEVMANFVVSKRENRMEKLLEPFLHRVHSSSMILSDGLADLSFGEVFQTMKCGHITEEFDGIKYRITPNSFFQSNSEIAVQMYRRLKEHVQGKTLDLYSGVGSISLFVADAASHVTGVEVVKEAVETSYINKTINDIDNVDFICADALDYMKEHSEDFDSLILDPPRSGMHPKMIKQIRDMKLDKIIYMSCNPATCRDDIKALEDYRVESLEAFDMFPQTPHVESIAILRRK